MKVIYNCYGGTHTSVMAAALHLGIFKEEQFPRPGKLLACPYFDKVEKKDVGKIYYMGRDEKGHEVYVMGCFSAGALVARVLGEFGRIMKINMEEVLFVSTLPCLNILIRAGGILSRRLRLVTLGRQLLIPGCRISYSKIKKVVREAKKALG